MAKSTSEWFEIIKAEALSRATAVGNTEVIDMLGNTSTMATWKVIFWACAFCAHLVESFVDLFRKETDDKINQQKTPTLPWWANMAETFQFGDNLVPEMDFYDNTGLTEADIAAKKVVKYAAAIEQFFANGKFGIRLKLAGEDAGGNRIKLPDAQLLAFAEFGHRVYPGGVYREYTTGDADHLKLSLRVYYNPLVLDVDGKRLDGNNDTSLQDAINSFLKNLPFNGRFNLTQLVDAMQKVDGVVDPRIISAQTKYAALAYTDVVDEIVPDAAYLKLYSPTDLTINWIPKSAI